MQTTSEPQREPDPRGAQARMTPLAELSDASAQAIVAAALEQAALLGVRVSVAVVDQGGALWRFVRMPGVHPATVDVALAKARCAISFRRPTRLFAEGLAAGNLSLLATPGVIVLPGGIPFREAEPWLGAIGISGAAPDVDERIAVAALDGSGLSYQKG